MAQRHLQPKVRFLTLSAGSQGRSRRAATGRLDPFAAPPLAGIEPCHGQMYPPPSGALKQPTDSGNSVFGSQSTACGKKIAKAIVKKKIT